LTLFSWHNLLPQHPETQLSELGRLKGIALELNLQLRALGECLLLAGLAGCGHTPLPVNDGEFVKGSSLLSLALDKGLGDTYNLLVELPEV